MKPEYYKLFEGYTSGDPVRLDWDRGNGRLSDTFVFLGSLPERDRVLLVNYKTATENRENVQLLDLDKLGEILEVKRDETVDKLSPRLSILLLNHVLKI